MIAPSDNSVDTALGLVETTTPPGVLAIIVATTAFDLRRAEAEAQAANLQSVRRFADALRSAATNDARGMALIAEVKPVSPAKGPLLARADVPAYVRAVAPHAAALSVLVDGRHFGGGYDMLAEVRALTDKPLLAKGFFLSTRQLDDARASGADAVLLMCSVLPQPSLLTLLQQARQRGLGTLIETHDADEVRRAYAALDALGVPGAEAVIGVNSRNLLTMHIDVPGAAALLATLPQGPDAPLRVAESGIEAAATLDGLVGKADAALIGSHLAAADQPAAAVAALGFGPAPGVSREVGPTPAAADVAESP